ncbi:MAG: hypothetical protein PWP31_1069 [Clostridia bacterium]|nr:hypothetical protein [Clostridia bacterium]
MDITPWCPWHVLNSFPKEMFFNGPRFDIYQTDSEVVINVYLPGLVSKNDVKITATEIL